MAVIKLPGVGPKFILRLIIELLTLIGVIYIVRSLNRIDNKIPANLNDQAGLQNPQMNQDKLNDRV